MVQRFLCIGFFLVHSAVAATIVPLDKVVALVNDGVITASELNVQTEAYKAQLLAKKVPLPPETALRKQVLQHLIDTTLEIELAKRNDVHIDAAEIEETIEKIANSNNLTRETLQQAVVAQGMAWSAYRASIQKEMLVARVQQKAIGRLAPIAEEQVEAYLKGEQKSNQEAQALYHVQNIVIPLVEEPTADQVVAAKAKAEALISKVKQDIDFSQLVTEESTGGMILESNDLGERHLAELPEVYAKVVTKMRVGEVSAPLRTGNGFQLLKLVAVNGENTHHVITETHLRHILLKADATLLGADAKKQINNIYQQIRSGKSFAKMAKNYSLDSHSAVKGGDLGWVKPGELVPEVEKVVEKLPLNTVSRPVKSSFGWHIIEVLGRKQVDDTAAFDRQQVITFLRQRQYVEAVENWQQHMRSQAYVKIVEKGLA